jgi:hypothetical protein
MSSGELQKSRSVYIVTAICDGFLAATAFSSPHGTIGLRNH